MAEHLNKTEKVAEALSYLYDTETNKMSALCGLLWQIAQGTRWQEDAENGILAVCPEFFEEPYSEEL